MGACMSSNTDETEQKKRSQMIDKNLEEESRRLRRECKILLLGTHIIRLEMNAGTNLRTRIWRKWEIDNCQTDENHTPEWLWSE